MSELSRQQLRAELTHMAEKMAEKDRLIAALRAANDERGAVIQELSKSDSERKEALEVMEWMFDWACEQAGLPTNNLKWQ